MNEAASKAKAMETPADGVQSKKAERRIFVVVNPTSADGEVGERWDEVSEMLRARFGTFGWRMTERQGHATALTTQALDEGYDTIITMGGDGTINETVNGFFRDGKAILEGATLGLLPMGTGGDFKRTLGLSGDLDEAATCIRRGYALPADVGRLTFVNHEGEPDQRYFINIASCGISGLVDKMVNESSKVLGGKLTFMLTTLRAWQEYEAPTLELAIDDDINARVSVVSVAVANGRFFGGGMKIAPGAQLDDGYLDIVIIRKMDLRQLVPIAYRVYEGRLFESPAVSHLQAKKITATPVDPNEVVLLDVDGEAPGRLPATFEVMEGAIRILRPKG